MFPGSIPYCGKGWWMRLFSPYILKSIALFLWTEAAAGGQKGQVYVAQLWASPLAPTQQWDNQLPAELYRRQTQALPHHCLHGCRWSTDSGQQVSKSLLLVWLEYSSRGGKILLVNPKVTAICNTDPQVELLRHTLRHLRLFQPLVSWLSLYRIRAASRLLTRWVTDVTRVEEISNSIYWTLSSLARCLWFTAQLE